MNQQIKEKWVAALRSGEYKQGTGVLRYTSTLRDKDVYCCLGVLCDIFKNETGRGRWTKTGIFRAVSEGGLTYRDNCNITDPISDWAGLKRLGGTWFRVKADSPYRQEPLLSEADDGDYIGLIALNDGGFTFEQIADIIEKEF